MVNQNTKNKKIGTGVSLRNVNESDLDLFFRFQLDKEANYMAAFTSRDPSDREAFDKHWKKN